MDRRSIAVASLALTLVLAMALPMGALAKGKPTVEATNNLSVPTIMLASGGFTNVGCGTNAFSALVPPPGDVTTVLPLNGYPVSPLDYYYVQGVHKWQAPCNSSTAVDLPVTAGWGDNLSGDAKLKVGSPIRVELGLFYTSADPVERLHRGQAGSGRARPRVRLRNPCHVRRDIRVSPPPRPPSRPCGSSTRRSP